MHLYFVLSWANPAQSLILSNNTESTCKVFFFYWDQMTTCDKTPQMPTLQKYIGELLVMLALSTQEKVKGQRLS
jgi:hypothetical protein